VATTIGVLTAMPLLIGSGAATVMSTGLSIDKFVDDRRDIQLSDMYFQFMPSGNSIADTAWFKSLP
jgi:hypothetical protein